MYQKLEPQAYQTQPLLSEAVGFLGAGGTSVSLDGDDVRAPSDGPYELDEEYEPSSDDELGESEDEGGDVELEEEDDFLCVDDRYDPTQWDDWDVDDGGYLSKLYKNGELFGDYVFGGIKLSQWQRFSDKDHIKDVVRDFCIQEGFSVIVLKADDLRYTVESATKGCDWRLHAARMADGFTWAIKTIGPEHICTRLGSYNGMANVESAGNKLMEDIRANPDILVKALNHLLFERHGLNMCISTLYKMKDWVIRKIQGGYDTLYSLLPAYCEMIKVTNPNSIAHCDRRVVEGHPERPLQFRYIFISFTAQHMGLIKGCRGLIGVDGTYLKGNHKGVLLSVVGLDGNNELFLIAYGVVDDETKSTWSSFFWHLKNTLSIYEREDLTIISGRPEGVEPTLEDMWPTVKRRFCCRHL